jgi:hypothetical protein
MKKLYVALVIIAVIISVSVVYSYITVSNGPIDPLGRLAFVKLENPDMFPGHPHSELLANYATERGSACVLVVNFAGSSNYRSYQEINTTNSNQSSVYIIEAAYIDTQGKGSANLTQINILDSLKIALFGVPNSRYKYMSDGVVYNTYNDMMAHVNSVAQQHGQQGPLPIVWHGTVRSDNPLMDPGCGFPLYFQILTKTYGLIPAYTYMIYGLIFPFFNSPSWNYELTHASQLQNLYKGGDLNYNYTNITSNTDKYIHNNLSKNKTSAIEERNEWNLNL